MRSRNHKDYDVIVQYSTYVRFDESGKLEEVESDENLTFWLEAKDGSFKRRYSIKSAPNWVKKIYNKLCQV